MNNNEVFKNQCFGAYRYSQKRRISSKTKFATETSDHFRENIFIELNDNHFKKYKALFLDN